MKSYLKLLHFYSVCLTTILTGFLLIVMLSTTALGSDPLQFDKPFLFSSALGTPFKQSLTAKGGTGSYTWSITAGSLPTGLALESSSGVISGIPTNEGTYVFTVKVKDSALSSTTKVFTISIEPVLWKKTYDAGVGEHATGVAVDSSGNVYVTGYQVLEYHTVEGSTSGTYWQYDHIALKYDSSGNVLWTKNFPHEENYFSSSIAIDKDDNIFMTGPNVVMKYDASGNQLWKREYSGGSPTDIAVDGCGKIYVTSGISSYVGYTAAYNTFGDLLWANTGGKSNIGLGVDTNCNVYVRSYDTTSKYDESGILQWANADTILLDTYTLGIAVDRDGNSYVAGNTYDVNSPTQIKKYDTTGTLIWQKELLKGYVSFCYHIKKMSLDGNGNVYVTGYYNNRVTQREDILTVKFDPSGNMLWAKTFEADAVKNENSYGMAIDNYGNTYLTGHTYFGSDGQNYDAITIKYKPDSLSITTNSLPSGTIGTNYSSSLTATSTVTWVVSSGALPDGLTLNASSGLISGFPTIAGTFTFSIQATDQSLSTVTKQFSIKIDYMAIKTTMLPPCTVGDSYNVPIAVVGGTAPYSWSIVAGNLPGNMTLDETTGVISGTPTIAGTYTFTVQAAVPSAAASRSFVLFVYNPAQITTTSLPSCITSNYYSQSLVASGGVKPYSWAIVSGSLPDGLTMSGSGEISGRPTTVGTWTFAVQLTNIQTITRSFTIIIYGPLTISTSSLHSGATGVPYGQTLIASYGIPPYTWSITSGTLPSGLSLNISTGAIMGIPSATGTSNFTVKVTDASTRSVTKALAIPIYTPLAISHSAPFAGTTGVLYAYNYLTATGGVPPYTWSISGDKPNWLNTGNFGSPINYFSYIYGNPDTAGTYVFSLQVQDAIGTIITERIPYQVYNPVSITTASLPAATIGAVVSSNLTATGGLTPYTWSISGGSLPDGLAIDSSTGVITGVPTTSGSFFFTVNAVDSLSNAAGVNFPMQILEGNTGEWLRLYNSGNGSASATSVTVDAGGNVYVTGNTDSAATSDYLTVKYDSSGNLKWAKTYSSGYNYDHANGITVDGSGNVYVTGDHDEVSSMGCSTVKYDSNGNFIRAIPLSGPCNAITVDGSGNIYVAAAYRSNPSTQPDYRVLKYNSSGSQLNSWTFGRSNFDMTSGISVDGSGNIYVTGVSYNPINTSKAEILTYKLNSSGGQIWSNIYTTSSLYNYSRGIVLDASGNVYVTGSAQDTNYCSLIKYNSSGTQQWVKNFSCNYGIGGNIATRGNSIYVRGYTDNGGVTIKYDTSGNVVWTRPEGTSISGVALAVGVNNDFYVSGSSYGYPAYFFSVARYSESLQFIASSLPSGTVNNPYNQTLSIAGGAPPYTWSITTGSLPTGLSLSSSTGTITGTPTSVGSWSFSAKATDAVGASTTKALAVTIANGLPRASFSGTPLSGYGLIYVQFTDTSLNNPSSWLWNFGDGTISTKQNPSHTFTATGAYPVSLTVTNSLGSDSKTLLDYISVSGSCSYTYPILISGALYSDIQTAYSHAADTNIIQIQALELTGDLTFDHDIRATLKGGYDCGYSINSAFTAILGSVRVSNGTVKLENLRFR